MVESLQKKLAEKEEEIKRMASAFTREQDKGGASWW